MKTVKVSLLALVFTVGIGGAVVQKIQAAPKPVDTFYNWTSSSIAPNHPSSNLSNSTRSTAINYYGCDTGADLCASGTRVSGSGPATAQLQLN